MRAVLTLVAVLFLCVNTARAATTVSEYDTIVNNTSGVLSHWKFDETSGTSAADAVGNVTGTYTYASGLGVAGAPGIGGSKAVNPLVSAVNMGSAYPFTGTANYTLEAWFKTRVTATNNSWIVDREVRSPVRSGYLLGYQPGTVPNNVFCKRYSNNTADSVDSQVAGYGMADRVWHHMVCTYDGAVLRQYIDGTLIGQVASTRSLLDSSAQPMWVGSQTPGPAAQPDGTLDDVAIYGRALTASEITRHYTAGQSYRDAVLATSGVQSVYALAGSSTSQPDDGAPNSPATASGASTVFQSAPLIADGGKSLSLRGDGHLAVSARQIAATGTTEFWFRPRALQDSWLWYTAAATTGDGGGPEQETGIRLTSAGKIQLWSTGQTASYVDLGTYTPGATRYLALSLSGSTWTAYLDGAQAYSAALGAQSFAGYLAATTYGGLMSSASAGAFDGELDDIAWYTSALPPAVIAAHEAIGRALTTTSLAAITSGPTSLTNQTSGTVGFASVDPTATFECSLDAGAWAVCTSPATFTGLAEGSHTVRVHAVTAAGNPGSAASATWTVDTTAPSVTITGSPTSPTNQTSATLTFASPDAGATFTCRTDGGAWGACTSPLALTALTDGSHTVHVQATDAAGNSSTAAQSTWVVDTAPPAATFVSGPADPTRSADALLGFASGDAAAQFECRVDGGTWAACTSPVSYSGLADGSHTAQVRGTDLVGNVGSAASYDWAVDTQAPEVVFSAVPSDPSGSSTASLAFSSLDAGASFECRADGSAWSPCASPLVLTGLSDGSHSVQVRATDVAGNVGSQAASSWAIDTHAPTTTFDSGPSDPTSSAGARLAFSSGDSAATFQCRLDGGDWAACMSPVTFSGLSDGPHAVDARATDLAGNTGAPARYGWTVDSGRPRTSLTAAPSGYVATPDVTFEFAADRAVVGYDCRLDGEAWEACSSPFAARFEDGIHSFGVRARTATGVLESDGPVRSFVIDTTPPQTSITAGPSGSVVADIASFQFAANEPVTRYDCSLDGASFSRCSPPLTTARLAPGSHTFAVRATDRASNREGAGGRASWSVVELTVTPTIKSLSSAGSAARATLRCGAPSLPGVTAVTYQWLRGGQPILGATGAEYTPRPDDRTARLTCAVRYAYDEGEPRLVVTSPVVTLGRAALHDLVVNAESAGEAPSASFITNRRTAVLIRIWCREASRGCPGELPHQDREYGRAVRDSVSSGRLVLVARRLTLVGAGKTTVDVQRLLHARRSRVLTNPDLYVSVRLAQLGDAGRIERLSAFLSRRLAQ